MVKSTIEEDPGRFGATVISLDRSKVANAVFSDLKKSLMNKILI